MKHKSTIGLLLAGMAGTFGALGLLLVLNLLNGGRGFAGTTAATAFGWLVPLATGMGVALLVVVLLARSHHVQSQDCFHGSVRCSSCGGALRIGWRLCPHCGVRVGSSEDR